MVVRIPTERIVDWGTFHTVFREVMGFPPFYGQNMDAWVDCMDDVDVPDGMTSVRIARGEVLTLHCDDVTSFARRCPDQYLALLEGTAGVNFRRLERGREAVLALSFVRRRV